MQCTGVFTVYMHEWPVSSDWRLTVTVWWRGALKRQSHDDYRTRLWQSEYRQRRSNGTTNISRPSRYDWLLRSVSPRTAFRYSARALTAHEILQSLCTVTSWHSTGARYHVCRTNTGMMLRVFLIIRPRLQPGKRVLF